jgi:stalled ribosome rescue protein Dom34
MQILKKDLKQGEVTVKVNHPEDLWFLNQVIDVDDIIKGRTERKIKIGKEEERKQAIVKKTVFLEVKAEKKEFHKYSDNLRIGGVIIQGSEDVPKGEHHTFDIAPGDIITIQKKEWLNYQLDKLREAAQAIKTKIVVLLFDREEAILQCSKTKATKSWPSSKAKLRKKKQSLKAKTFTRNWLKNLASIIRGLSLRA